MPWTESRSREEWLAEVQRRGERIRRRRRVRFGVVGALALLLPVSVTATALRSGPERTVELSVAGPKPAGDVPDPTSTIPVETRRGGVDSAAPATEQATPPAGAPSPTTTTTEVHRRVASANGSVEEPTPAAPVAAADDPVVARPSTTLAPPGKGQAVAAAAPVTTVPPTTTVPTDPPPTTCSVSDFRMTVATDKAAYAAGEAVQVMATMEKRSASPCRMPDRAHVRVDNAAGRNVVSFPYTIDIRVPDRAEPGEMFTGSYTWDQRDCVNAGCAQVPAGTYTARGEAPISDPVSFKIGP